MVFAVLLQTASAQTSPLAISLQVQGNQTIATFGSGFNNVYHTQVPIVLKGMVEGWLSSGELAGTPTGASYGIYMDPNGVEYISTYTSLLAAEPYIIDTLNFAEGARCNYIPLYMSVQSWVNNTYGYQQDVEYFITQAAVRGMFVEPTFYSTNDTNGEIGYFPWNQVGNNFINNTADFVNLWGNVSEVLNPNDYPSVVFHLWNEPNDPAGNAMATWMSVTQQCITRIRSTGATQPVCVMFSTGTGWDVNPANTGQYVGFNTSGQNMSAWVFNYPLTDPDSNVFYAIHSYRFSMFNSSGVVPAGYWDGNWYGNGYTFPWIHPYDYNSILTCLTEDGVLAVAAVYPVVCDEISCGTMVWDPANETTWFNNILNIFDAHGIGYCGYSMPGGNLGLAMADWSFCSPTYNYVAPTPCLGYNYGYVAGTPEFGSGYWNAVCQYTSGCIDYTLDAGGVILVQHMGGNTNPPPAPTNPPSGGGVYITNPTSTPTTPAPTPQPQPFNLNTITDVAVIVLILIVLALAIDLHRKH